MMSKNVLVPLLFATGLFGQAPSNTPVQTVETIPLRAILSSALETTPPANAATGAATVLLHVVRDATGKVVSGSADATVSYSFATPTTAVAMHIHQGPQGVDGPIVVPFNLTRTDVSAPGTFPEAQTNFPSDSVSVDTINGILADPTQFYYNVHTTDSPGGAMRGQLQLAEMTVRMALLRPENETPPITGNGSSGVASLVLLVTRSITGAPSSAYAIFDMAYNGFPGGATFTGLNLQNGAAQSSGPVVINSGLNMPPAVGTNGSGVLHSETEVNLSDTGTVDAVNSVVNNASSLYINTTTADFPNGAVRGQLQPTDRIDYQLTLSPANEVPPIADLNASVPSRITIYTLRNADGTVAAGTVIFDENPRFPPGTALTATHIHNGVAGQNGPVIIDSRLRAFPLLVTNGTGNIYRIVTVADPAGIATLNSMVTTPYQQYLNLHTSANPGGAARAQLMTATAALPTITSVQTAVPFGSVTKIAPGSLFSISGSNFSALPTDLSGIPNLRSFPTSLNGVSVTIGGVQAPLKSVASGTITGQVPFNLPTGTQLPVVVSSSTGMSTAFNITLNNTAPAIVTTQTGAIATRQSDNATINAGTPATAGDVVLVMATGLGLTTPVLTAGAISNTSQPYPPLNDVSASIGGVNTSVLYARALSNMPGLYQVAIVVPAGLAPGNEPLLLKQGLVTSNVVAIPIQ